MQFKAELICVSPERIHEVWPHVAHLIHSAVKRTNLSHTLDIELEVLHGKGLLWLAWDGRTIKAAATTALIKTDAELVCVLTACGGEEMGLWIPLLPMIEKYAKAEGCACMRIYGRRGWARVLPDYTVEHVILERTL